MYRTAAFDVADLDTLHRLMRSAGAAHLVASRSPDAGGGLDSSVLPMLLDTGPHDGPLGTLRGHLARANPQWRDADPDVEALVIFAGSDAYVSPSWYPSKQGSGKVVPTWNYEVVHAHGRLSVHDDVDWLRAFVTRLTDHHEAGRPEPWAVTDAPEQYVAAMLKGIVGVEVRITRLEGKRKLSQNRPDDVAAVQAALAGGSPGEQAVAAAMRDVSE